MSRSAGGTYTLPAGNPVVTDTVVDSSDHNDTMNDIALEMTDSLNRSGKGAMLSVLKIVDGSVASTGIQFSADPNTGLFRPAIDTVDLVAGGASVIRAENAVATLLKRTHISNSGGVDLTDSEGALVIGALVGQHIEFDDAEIQSKSNATTSAILALNRLGGSVLIGAQSGTGVVALYSSGDVSLETMENGVLVKDGDGVTPTINLVTGAGVAVGQLIYSAGLYLQSLVNSAQIVLNGYSSGGVQRSVFSGDPNGNASVYYAGGVGFQVTNTGGILYSSVHDNPELALYQDDKTTRNALIQASTGGLYFYQEVNGQPITFVSDNNAGVQKTIFSGDPDGTTDLYAAGSLAAQFNNIGVYLFSTANDAPEIQFYRADKTTRNGFFIASTSSMGFVNEVHGTPVVIIGEDNAGTQRTLISADPDVGVSINYYDSAAFATAPISTNGTGATVTDGGGVARPVGMNVTPITSIAVATDLRIANAGHQIYATASLAVGVDITTDAAPNGTVWIVANESGGNITITATGVTLRWFDGGVGGTGTRTLANYSKAAVTKRANGLYQIEGSGLS